MKFNWGIGLVIGMSLFICFILCLVITMSTDNKYNHDLVTENYYAKEMVYQNEIDAETNTENLSEKIISHKTKKGWEIIFPKELDPKKIEGKLMLYRPSNKKLDQEIQLNLNSSTLLIPAEKFIAGRWNIILEWKHEGKSYLYKQQITY